jgi:hypothetical protein
MEIAPIGQADGQALVVQTTETQLATISQKLVIPRSVRHLDAIPFVPKQIELEEEDYIAGVSRIVFPCF